MSQLMPPEVVITGAVTPASVEILSPPAVTFVAKLGRKFEQRRRELLALRARRQRDFDAGGLPDFLAATRHVRESEWRIGAVPHDLQDRRVEITGPTDRKMVINALNSGANVFMADFEDSNAPLWRNMIDGQLNLRDAVRRTIAFKAPEGRSHRLNDRIATLIVRPRGWHLPEKHMLIDGEPISAAIFDFGLYFFHNAKLLLANSSGPYLYLPKLEGHLEAQLWNDIFVAAQRELGIPQGTIKATVLIETVLAAFEMEEILYALREHCVGLNIGRWDYIFSCIKKFHAHRDFCLADRAQVTMTAPFMRAYALLLVATCHRRGAFAMGGMAAQIPVRSDPVANAAALQKVRADKLREVVDGCDGSWVAHPGLVGVAKAVFDQFMPLPNQVHRLREDVAITAAELLDFQPQQPITEAGLKNNVNVGIRYIGAWLAGNGCVPVNHLMEDVATAEIARSQIWQWIRSPSGVLDDGRKVTVDLFRSLLADELRKVRHQLGPVAWKAGRYEAAARLFEQITVQDEFVEFLTLPGYEWLTDPVFGAAQTGASALEVGA